MIALAVGSAALSGWWYLVHQRGFPMQIDESGYTSFALAQTDALHRTGLHGLIHSVETQSVHGPLVPLLTVPLDLVAGPRVGNGFLVVLGFYALLVVATYALTRRLTTPWLAALAALIVATAPGVLTYARAYYFAVPAAALLTAAVCCFLQSDGLTRTRWALAAGFLLGLALLSRTQVLALAPGVVIAAIALTVTDGRRRLARRLVNMAGATLVAIGVAATWYTRNLGDAVAFLRGTRFRPTTSGRDPYHLAPVLRDVRQALEVTQLPTAIVLIAIAVLVGARAARVWARRHHEAAEATDGPGGPLRGPDSADRLFLMVILAEAIAVFAAADIALGEWLLVLPILVALAMAGLASLSDQLRLSLGGLLVTLAICNGVMVSSVAPALAEVRTVDMGAFGPLTITDGRQLVQRTWAPFDSGPPGRLRGSLRRVPPLQRGITAWMLGYASRRGQQPVAFAVGSESRFLNINDLLLNDRLIEHRGLLATGRFELATTSSIGHYCAWLDDPRLGLPNLVTIHRDILSGLGDRAAPSPAERRVAKLGFRVVRTVDLPDGPTLIWWRSQAAVPTSCPR